MSTFQRDYLLSTVVEMIERKSEQDLWNLLCVAAYYTLNAPGERTNIPIFETLRFFVYNNIMYSELLNDEYELSLETQPRWTLLSTKTAYGSGPCSLWEELCEIYPPYTSIRILYT